MKPTRALLLLSLVSAAVLGYRFLASAQPKEDPVLMPGLLAKPNDLVIVKRMTNQFQAIVIENSKSGVKVVPQDPTMVPLPEVVSHESIVKILGQVRPSTGVRYLGNPMQVETGKKYRSRIELKGMEASLANAGRIREALEDAGFKQVAIYKDKDLDSSWPKEVRGDGPGVWFAEGVWSAPSGSAERPSQIAKAWEA